MRKDELLQAHRATETGLWAIHGEDPNCDLGGYHSNPLLATVEGRYADVVEYALNLKGFFGWGSGGYIEKIEPTKITKIKKIGKGKNG
jgi:hypothetical protein